MMSKFKELLEATWLKIKIGWKMNNHLFTKLFRKSHDGGANSGVTGYWL